MPDLTPEPDAPGVVVLGEDAEVVQAEVARRRAGGERAAGFVGDERAVAEAMGAELFGTAGVVPCAAPGS